MKEYIRGYYCRDDLHLQVMNKESNRKILQALKDAYPEGLTVEELAKKTKLPIKTPPPGEEESSSGESSSPSL